MNNKLCPRCRQKHEINYYKKDGENYHTICKECRDALFKNQPPTINLNNSTDKY